MYTSHHYATRYESNHGINSQISDNSNTLTRFLKDFIRDCMSLVNEVLMGFTVGAFAVPSLSLGADRYGSKVAGAFGGFPATVAASLFFLGRAEGPEAAKAAAEVVPMMEGYFGVFLTCFVLLASRGLFVSLGTSLFLWALLTLIPLFVFTPDLYSSVIVLIICLLISQYILESKVTIDSSPGGAVKLSVVDIASRMLMGGSVVGLSVILGATMGPVIGGIIASVPAVVISTLLLLHLKSGAQASAAFAKSLLLNALVCTGLFTAVASLSYVPFGMIGGTLIGFAATAVGGLGCWYYARNVMA